MIETYYAGAYWLGRAESATQCAQRASAFFQKLSHCDPLYTRWFEQARTRKQALQRQFEPTQATFETLFAKKKYQRQVGGFMLGAWTGHKEEGHGGMVSFACGCDSDIIPNSCVINLPDEDPNKERVVSAPVLAQVLRAMILAWEPDWGIATSSAHRQMVSERGELGTFVGWVMYFSRQRGTVPPLPTPVRVEPVEDKGTLILLTPERFTATNPQHVELAAQVHALLDQAGLLGPIQP